MFFMKNYGPSDEIYIVYCVNQNFTVNIRLGSYKMTKIYNRIYKLENLKILWFFNSP